MIAAFIGSVGGAWLLQRVDPSILAGLMPALLIAMAAYFTFSPMLGETDRHARVGIAGLSGLIGMIGKAERGHNAVEVISRFKVAYLMATGGAAYLVSRAIKGARVVAFEDLGMEAIYEFEVEDMPVTVAVDAAGNNVHTLAPAEWRRRSAEGEFEPAE